MLKVITISREYGAGGRPIGQILAETLHVTFYDKDIIRETAKESGYDIELIESEGEDVSKASAILKKICDVSSIYYHDPQDAIFDIQKQIVTRFARQGPCVILGRCADAFLRESGVDCLNVFIHADNTHRAARISDLTGITDPAEIQKLIEKKDDSRHTYYQRYTGKRWGDSRNYQMTLDSGSLGYDLCVKLIQEAAQN